MRHRSKRKKRGQNGKWQAGKWERTCPQPSSQSPAFSSIDNPTSSHRTSLFLNFLSLLALLSHFSFVFSVVFSRVRAPRVISRPPLRCLTTHREKLIRGWHVEPFAAWAFNVISPFLVVRSCKQPSFYQEAIVWSRSWVKARVPLRFVSSLMKLECDRRFDLKIGRTKMNLFYRYEYTSSRFH